MSTGSSLSASKAIQGRRVKITVSEPDTFVRGSDDVRYGEVARVLTLSNEAGNPCEVAFVRLDSPLAYGVHSSEVVSLMTRYAKNELADLLRGDLVVVNIGLEDPWVLDGDETDPKMKDGSLGFHLGYGTALIANSDRDDSTTR